MFITMFCVYFQFRLNQECSDPQKLFQVYLCDVLTLFCLHMIGDKVSHTVPGKTDIVQ